MTVIICWAGGSISPWSVDSHLPYKKNKGSDNYFRHTLVPKIYFIYLCIMKSDIDVYVVLWIIIFGLVIFNWIYNNDDDN